MASSKIKGITIEIGGNTTKLQDALKGVDRQVYALNGDLKALNQALKLDPTNINLLAQKQDVLKRNIEATKNRLDTLKEAQKQMGSYKHLTDEQKDSYNALSLEIAKAEDALKSMKSQLQVLPGLNVENLKNGLKQVGEVALDVSKKVLQLSAALAGAVAGVITAGVKSYGELEKAQKGSERLFGESFKTVEKNASEAYKTMGLSATEYYDQVNTYAVGLKEALGGSSQEAATLANDILKAQADIVAATGASQEQVQSAFSAVMRGNFTMIDNLRLGIKGSQQGMQEVINKVNEWNKAQGRATNYQMGNYADMQKALVDYTKMVGVAGTAQQQMSETIQGSLSQMKSAWKNFITGTGSPQELLKTVNTFLKNILKTIKNLAPNIVSGLVELFNELIPELVSMSGELLPIVINGAKSLLDGLINFINRDNSQFVKMAVSILKNISDFILRNLPLLLQASIKIISELAIGIAQAAPDLIPAIVECILTIVDTLLEPENIKLIINAAFELIKGIIQGIILAIPKIIEKVPDIVKDIATEITNNVDKIEEAGKELIAGLWRGITAKWDYYKAVGGGNGLQGWARTVVNDIKSKFGIHSPSTVMRDEIGANLGLGIVEGINDTVTDVENAMSNLSSKVEASVNPTINPTANSNPLYITIDKFYNNRDTDIQQLAEELEFYRKNSALAKGGV